MFEGSLPGFPERADADYEELMASDAFEPDMVDKLSEYIQILQADRASLAEQLSCARMELLQARQESSQEEASTKSALWGSAEQQQLEELKGALLEEGRNNQQMCDRMERLRQSLERALKDKSEAVRKLNNMSAQLEREPAGT